MVLARSFLAELAGENVKSLQKELLEGEEGKEKEPFPSFVLSTVNLSV